MRFILLRGPFALLLFVLSPLFSASQSAPSLQPPKASEPLLLHQFEDKYRKAGSLKATFLERYSENGRVLRTESGTAYFRRPGKMRWEYESPEKNLFLVDGKTAWFYVPSDHTVTRVPAKQSEDWRTPLALLAGEMKVSRICAHVEPALTEKPERPDHEVLSCQLRGARPELGGQRSQGASLQSAEASDAVFFEIAGDSGELVRVLVRQPGGLGIEFHFKNWQFDPQVGESLFRFRVPSGVAIVNGELPAGNGSI